MEDTHNQEAVDRFLLEQIDTIPQLEALLLFWTTRPRLWSVEDLAARLYVSSDVATDTVQELAFRELIELEPSSTQYRYRSESSEQDRLIGLVDTTYRREIVRMSNLIHSKGSPAVRAFARAFRVRKERK